MNHNHEGKKHGMLMVLCCLIPVVAILILPRLGLHSGLMESFTSYGLFGIFFLLHIGIMIFMMIGKKDKHPNEKDVKE